jgi:peroxiredoxin
MTNDMLIVSYSQQAYLYKIDMRRYLKFDAPKGRDDEQGLPEPLPSILADQNPSLLFALSKDIVQALASEAETIDRVEDTALPGDETTRYKVLSIKAPGQEIRAFVHPTTSLLHQLTLDVKETLIRRGVPDVKTAMITLNYSKSQVDAPLAATEFSWSPPAEALLVRLPAAGEGMSPDDFPALTLMGKPAPNFTLTKLSGEKVTLSELRGSVVVLDFWATWCGPCVQWMPLVDALHKAYGDRGVKVFAVNQQEPKELVERFMQRQRLSLPALLDESGKAGEAFKVTGIPQTVVIGRMATCARCLSELALPLRASFEASSKPLPRNDPAPPGQSHTSHAPITLPGAWLRRRHSCLTARSTPSQGERA